MLDVTQALFSEPTDANSIEGTSSPNTSLGKDDFLQLLVTQMQYQDPLDPLKNEQFVAQMAQFSELEQMMNLNETADAIRMLETSINNSQAVNLIGKDITVQGNSFEIIEGEPTAVNYTLEDDANRIEISVFDQGGQIVRSMALDGRKAGNHSWDFDGKDDLGNALADGPYSFTVKAFNENGDPVNAATYSNVRVDGLSFDNGILYLMAAGGQFRLSDIVEVRQ